MRSPTGTARASCSRWFRQRRSSPSSTSGLFGQDSYVGLLVAGFFLGIGGTAFAVGVPFVNAWFPPEPRGLAVGVIGAGMVGTAISALTTVKLYENAGDSVPFLLTAAALAVYAVAAWVMLRDAPSRVIPAGSFVNRLSTNARLSITWQACLLCAVAFGGYVAFPNYLPAYLKTAHGLEPADAANRATDDSGGRVDCGHTRVEQRSRRGHRYGGQEHDLRQTVIALAQGRSLGGARLSRRGHLAGAARRRPPSQG
ncbi:MULTISPECIES: MFS transporter [Nocardioides]|uniref:MFS transporter n=1 Tax=Nocardioides vastitatis TaxID=2568655 RepID=A0ABW0ZJ17_9ACTN|nr:MFS transporter [Nocardioides sp.]